MSIIRNMFCKFKIVCFYLKIIIIFTLINSDNTWELKQVLFVIHHLLDEKTSFKEMHQA